MNFLLSKVLCIYSITTGGFFIHCYLIFSYQNKDISKSAFCGLCPHPASGIRLGFSGNTLNADGIRLGRLPFHLEPPWLFLFINTVSAFLRIGRSAGSAPGPSRGISGYISLWCSHWPDTASSSGTSHWVTHFSFSLLFGTGSSDPQWCLSCYADFVIARLIPTFTRNQAVAGAFWKNVGIVFKDDIRLPIFFILLVFSALLPSGFVRSRAFTNVSRVTNV